MARTCEICSKKIIGEQNFNIKVNLEPQNTVSYGPVSFDYHAHINLTPEQQEPGSYPDLDYDNFDICITCRGKMFFEAIRKASKNGY